MATVHDQIETLTAYIEGQFAIDFDRLKIQKYGFQAPGLLDPTKPRSGRSLRGLRNVTIENIEPVTVPVLLGRISPIAGDLKDSEEEAFQLIHRVALAIGHWSRCEAIGLAKDCVVNCEIAREQDRNISGNKAGAWWWVIRWQFELVGYFDAE